MKNTLLKSFLIVLRGLVHAKRGVFWIFRILGNSLIYTLKKIYQFIGINFYKLNFNWKKNFGDFKIPWDSGIVELVGRRATLQIILLIVTLYITIPQSKLYTPDALAIPGRDTMLYKIVGPGEQDFNLVEEINSDFTYLKTKTDTSWKEGAVVNQPNATIDVSTISQPDITSLVAGGTALSKPIIISNNGSIVQGESGRTEIIYHLVQEGDTIGVIAEKYGISLQTILWANNLSTRSYIRSGDKLKILPASGLTHKVVRGDNISKIAKLYKTDTQKIITYNKLKEDGSDVIIGQELIIPGGTKPQPIYTQPTTVRNTQTGKTTIIPQSSTETPTGAGYLWPTAVRRITQYFGLRHTGLDIAGPIGTPIYATRSGRVIKSQCGWNGGYGCYAIIDHGNGVQSLYGHASRLLISVGEQVEQGQTIMLMGSTGRSTGSHLHFEIRTNNIRSNPLKYVK